MADIPAVTSRTGDLFGELNIREYLQILQRRWWWIALSAMVVFLAASVVIFRLPNVYRAETVILVDPQKVPDSYVASTVTGGITDRLSTIQQEVMSPTRLKRLIDSMHLYSELRGRVDEQQVVKNMQKAVSVEVVNPNSRQTSAFRIAFHGRDPVEVAQVTNQLASMFIEANLKTREQQSFGTAEFLENELAKTKQQLDEKETELQNIKSRYVGDLPDSKQFHLEALSTLRTQLAASQERSNRAQQERVYVQSMMVSNPPTIDLDAGGAGGGSSPAQSQVQKLEARLSELQARYGPEHPAIKQVRAQLETLRAQAAEEEPAAPPKPAQPVKKGPLHNPVLEAQLQKLNDEIQEQSRIQAQLQQQINFHVSKLENVPIFEQRIAGLMRDHDSLRVHYTQLLDKKLSAEMASNLEMRQKGERFVVLDPAQTPERPFAPNRPLLGFGALFVGVLVGVGVVAVFEFSDQSVRSEQEASRILLKPVLGGVPQMRTRRQVRMRRARVVAVFAASAVCSVGLGFAISILSQKVF